MNPFTTTLTLNIPTLMLISLAPTMVGVQNWSLLIAAGLVGMAISLLIINRPKKEENE